MSTTHTSEAKQWQEDKTEGLASCVSFQHPLPAKVNTMLTAKEKYVESTPLFQSKREVELRNNKLITGIGGTLLSPFYK